MKLTEHFTLEEFIKSDTAKATGIDNTPSPEVVENLKQLCVHVLEPLRQKWGSGISITSGYRCAALNKAVGGAKDSQHERGEAADIVPTNGKTLALLMMLQRSGIEFDQLINEKPDKNGVPAWIHVSYKALINLNRHQVLTIK